MKSCHSYYGIFLINCIHLFVYMKNVPHIRYSICDLYDGLKMAGSCISPTSIELIAVV